MIGPVDAELRDQIQEVWSSNTFFQLSCLPVHPSSLSNPLLSPLHPNYLPILLSLCIFLFLPPYPVSFSLLLPSFPSSPLHLFFPFSFPLISFSLQLLSHVDSHSQDFFPSLQRHLWLCPRLQRRQCSYVGRRLTQWSLCPSPALDTY